MTSAATADVSVNSERIESGDVGRRAPRPGAVRDVTYVTPSSLT